MRSGPPSSIVVAGFGAANERRMATAGPVVVRVLLSKVNRAGASPTEGFGGPVSLALSATNIKTSPPSSGSLAVMLVLSVALRNVPASVKDGGSCATRLDRERVELLVLTVLPLS